MLRSRYAEALRCCFICSMCNTITFYRQLNIMLNAELSVADRECLEEFVRVRQGLAADLGMSFREHDSMISYQSNEVEELSTHELLIAEVLS